MKFNEDYLNCFGVMKTKIKPVAIVIHHTATANPKRTREALKKKNCSTHFEIDRDGTIYKYRDENLMCSHCGSSNCHAIGIDLTHPTGSEFTKAQITSLNELLKYLCDKWNIPFEIHETLSGIYPHRALGNTKCPDNLPMDEIRCD